MRQNEISGSQHNNKPDGIFVGGCDRSGTTLLLSMLNAHPDIIMSYEATLPLRLYDQYSELTNSNTTELINVLLKHPAFVGVSREDISHHLDGTKISFQSLIRAAYAALAESREKSIWGDKSPDYVLNFNLLANLFPGSALIHIYRDPRAVVNSLLSRKWGPKTAKYAAKYWHKKVSCGIESFDNQLQSHRTLSVCYESLVSFPEKEAIRICDFLKIDYDDCMLNPELHRTSIPKGKNNIHPYIGEEINKKQIEKWKSLSKRDVRVIEAICGDLMDKLGYERSLSRDIKVGFIDHLYYKVLERWRKFNVRS